MPRTSGSSPWLSWVLAAETPIERGRPVRIQFPACAELVQDQAVKLAPDPGPAPLGEPSVRGRARRPEDWRQLLPRALRRGYEQDRGQHLPVTVTPSAPALRAHRRWGYHPLEQLPQPARNQALHRRQHEGETNDQANREGL